MVQESVALEILTLFDHEAIDGITLYRNWTLIDLITGPRAINMVAWTEYLKQRYSHLIGFCPMINYVVRKPGSGFLPSDDVFVLIDRAKAVYCCHLGNP